MIRVEGRDEVCPARLRITVGETEIYAPDGRRLKGVSNKTRRILRLTKLKHFQDNQNDNELMKKFVSANCRPGRHILLRKMKHAAHRPFGSCVPGDGSVRRRPGRIAVSG
jgi:hypothetical protein